MKRIDFSGHSLHGNFASDTEQFYRDCNKLLLLRSKLSLASLFQTSSDFFSLLFLREPKLNVYLSLKVVNVYTDCLSAFVV